MRTHPPLRALLLSTLLAWCACSNNGIADNGSGTNTGNAKVASGVVQSSTGAPMRDAIVRFIPNGFSAPLSTIPDSLIDTTGIDGSFAIFCDTAEGALTAEHSGSQTAAILPRHVGSSDTLVLHPRTTLAVVLIDLAPLMEGTLTIRDIGLSADIHRGDTLVTFTNVPCGILRGIDWHPLGAPADQQFEVAQACTITAESDNRLILGGAGRWYALPGGPGPDTVRALARTASGAIWVGVPGRGLWMRPRVYEGPWLHRGETTTDLDSVRGIATDGEKVYAAGITSIHSTTDGTSFTDVTVTPGSGPLLALAAANGHLLALWRDRAVLVAPDNTQRTFTSSSNFTGCASGAIGTFAVSTQGAGILLISQTDSSFITVSDGLPSDTVSHVALAPDGTIRCLSAEGFTSNAGGTFTTEPYASGPLSLLKNPRGITVDTAGVTWLIGERSFAISGPLLPSRSTRTTFGSSPPYPDFFAIAPNENTGAVFGGIGGILQAP